MFDTTAPGPRLRPVAVAEPLPPLTITEDQAVERILALQDTETRTTFDTALEIGDIVSQFVRADDAVDPKGALVRIAERTGNALSTLRTRGLVAERIPPEVRAHPRFRECGSWTVIDQIAQTPEPDLRAELFDKVLNQPPPPDAKNGRWRVNDIRALQGRSLATSWTTPVSAEERKARLLELLADKDLLAEVVNDRGDDSVSDAERAFFEARAPYLLETHRQYVKSREAARLVEEQSALDMPSLHNIGFLGRVIRRIEADAQAYIDLAESLQSPLVAQQHTWLSQITPALDLLESAIARVRATLPDSIAVPDDEPDDDMVIDAQMREVLERFALPSYNEDYTIDAD